MAVYPLQRVTRLPDVCFARWRLSGGAAQDVALTPAAYAALHQNGAGAPRNTTGDPAAVWIQAWSEPRFDTASGALEPGDVGVFETGPEFFNGGPGVQIGLEAKDRQSLKLSMDAVTSLDDVSKLAVSDTKRAGVAVVDGELRLDDARVVR